LLKESKVTKNWKLIGGTRGDFYEVREGNI